MRTVAGAILVLISVIFGYVYSTALSGPMIRAVNGRGLQDQMAIWSHASNTFMEHVQTMNPTVARHEDPTPAINANNFDMDGSNGMYRFRNNYVEFFNGTLNAVRNLGGRNGYINSATRIRVTDDGNTLYACVARGSTYGPANSRSTVTTGNAGFNYLLKMDITNKNDPSKWQTLTWTDATRPANTAFDCDKMYTVGNFLIIRTRPDTGTATELSRRQWYRLSGTTWLAISSYTSVDASNEYFAGDKFMFLKANNDFKSNCDTSCSTTDNRLQRQDVTGSPTAGGWTDIWINDQTIQLQREWSTVNRNWYTLNIGTSSNLVFTDDGNTMYFTCTPATSTFTDGTRTVHYTTNQLVFKADISTTLASTSPTKVSPLTEKIRFSSAQTTSSGVDNVLTNSGFSLFYDRISKSVVAYASSLNFLAHGEYRKIVDRTFEYYHVPVNGYVQWDSSKSTWIPAYGGGFSNGNPPAQAAPHPMNAKDAIYFFGPYETIPFNRIYNTLAHQIIVWNDKSNVKQWRPVFSQDSWNVDYRDNLNSEVLAFHYKTVTDTKIEGYIAGMFRSIRNTTVNSIAMIDSSGTVTPLGSAEAPTVASYQDVGVRKFSTSADGVLRNTGKIVDIIVKSHGGEDYIYVAGDFDIAGNVPVSNVARYRAASKTWHDVYGGVAAGDVKTMVDDKKRSQICVAVNPSGGRGGLAGGDNYASRIHCFKYSGTQEWRTINIGSEGNIQAITFWRYQMTIAVSGTRLSWRQSNSRIFAYDGSAFVGIDEELPKGTCDSFCSDSDRARYTALVDPAGIHAKHDRLFVRYGKELHMYHHNRRLWQHKIGDQSNVEFVQPDNTTEALVFDSNGVVIRYEVENENGVAWDFMRGYPQRGSEGFSTVTAGAASVQISLLFSMMFAAVAVLFM